MTPPVGSKTAQNYELQAGTNILGPFLFTKLLTPLLEKTAGTATPGSVRVTWAASLATMGAPKGGVEFEAQTGALKTHNNKFADYAQSKSANALLAREFAAKHSSIISNAWNPGNLVSELQRHQKFPERQVTQLLIYPTKLGGYTELFAGWSPEAGEEANKGKYIGPWGRFVGLRQDIKDNEAGAKKLWEWCERETANYV
jgi:retinol dehydrogenase 12